MINIITNGSWGITGPDWVSNVPISGEGPFIFNPEVKPNVTGVSRSSNLVVSTEKPQDAVPVFWNGTSLNISTVDISYSGSWRLTGPDWIEFGTTSGTGSASIPIDHPGSDRAPKTGTIYIIYGSLTKNYPVTQYSGSFVSAYVFVLGQTEDAGQGVHYKIQGNSDTIEDITSVNTTIDISNNPGVGVIPDTGNTMIVTAYQKGYGYSEKPFSPNLGNKVYYLSSSNFYGNGIDVIAAGATNLSMSYSAGAYSGSFTYTHNNFFYIVIDSRNAISVSHIPSDAGLLSGSGLPVNVYVDYGSNNGYSATGYSATFPLNLSASLSGLIVGSSSSLNSYSTSFTKSSSDKLILAFSGAISDNFTITATATSLRSFIINATPYATPPLACAAISTGTTKYHNGSTTYPDVGCIIYADSAGATRFNGGGSYYHISSSYYRIQDNGLVDLVATCASLPVASPVITNPGTIYAGLNVGTNLGLTATNSPYSWSITYTAYFYLLDGGTTGRAFSYTDYSGNTQYITLHAGEQATVIAQPTPAVTYGSAYTPVQQDGFLPFGATIDSNGNLYVESNEYGSFSITVTATNYIGSGSVTFTIKVTSPSSLVPFSMSSIGYGSSVSSCASSDCTATYWVHGGQGYTPSVNDIVFIDGYGEDYFNGGYLYYKYGSYSLLIDSVGRIVQKTAC